MTATKPKPKAPRRPAARHPAHARRQGLRTAAPRPPSGRGSRASTRAELDEKERELTFFERLGYTAAGAGVASAAGALATRWGFHPRTISIVLGAAGAAMIAKFKKNKDVQAAGQGAFSAGGSQLMLLLLKGAQAQEPAPQVASKDTQPSQPAKEQPRRQLGALPPGALDAAFERARSTLTMDAEGHEYAYGYPGY